MTVGLAATRQLNLVKAATQHAFKGDGERLLNMIIKPRPTLVRALIGASDWTIHRIDTKLFMTWDVKHVLGSTGDNVQPHIAWVGAVRASEGKGFRGFHRVKGKQ